MADVEISSGGKFQADNDGPNEKVGGGMERAP